MCKQGMESSNPVEKKKKKICAIIIIISIKSIIVHGGE